MVQPWRSRVTRPLGPPMAFTILADQTGSVTVSERASELVRGPERVLEQRQALESRREAPGPV